MGLFTFHAYNYCIVTLISKGEIQMIAAQGFVEVLAVNNVQTLGTAS